MGLFFSVIAQLNAIPEVLAAAMLAVWDGLLNFLDYFIQPWRNAFWFCFNIYVCVWSEIGFLIVKILLLPFRIYNAIQKEDRMVEELEQTKKLHAKAVKRIQELECELEQTLDGSKLYKDRLEKIEDEKRAFLKKFQVLQLRVMHLEEENDVLKSGEEIFLKGSHERHISPAHQPKSRNIRSSKDCRKNEVKDTERRSKDRSLQVEYQQVQTAVPIAGKIPLPYNQKPEGFPANLNKSAVSHHGLRREGWQTALMSSIFSVFLTLLVGTIAWEADDPCIPLVVAVFMVVCMSLKNVVQFLSSVCNGAGLDALALLSFNCFLLGTLAYPVLPRVASTVAPYGTRFGHLFSRVTGITYIIARLK